MQRITWYALLAVVALVAPIAGWAQARQAQTPKAKVRELASIKGDVSGFVRLPSGRALIYSVGDRSVGDSTFVYDIETKHRTLLGTDMYPLAVSPQSDRFAFSRPSEDRTENFLWTMPIDPKTGIGTGQAQRVSLRPENSGNARFSPDGKMLAFRAGLRSDSRWDIVLVPATGGAEHVVANYPDREAFAWAVDGKSLYVERGRRAQTAIERVPVAGGRSEPMFPQTALTNNWVVGLSPDARAAIFQNNPDRFYYRTASGIEGEISVDLPPLDDGWGHDFSLESTRYTTMTQVRNQRVRVLNVATGQARDLLPGNVQSRAPAWSPDGRRLAVLSGNRSHYDITVVNADGSSPRRYPVPMHPAAGEEDDWRPDSLAWEKPWSPDGRFLAFQAKDRDKVGDSPDDHYELALLDLNSGQTRVLATSSATIGDFVWRPDGKAIRTLKRTVVPMRSPSRWSIVQIPVNGAEQLLRDISAEFPKVNDLVFASDRTVVVRVATDQSPEFFLVPLDGGTARRLKEAGPDPGLPTGGFLVAGDRLLLATVSAKGGAGGGLKILSFAGDSTRTISPGIRGHHGVPHPDGKQIINVGKATGDSDSVWKLFVFPLDGSPSRVIGEIPRGTGGLLAPSPDGKLLAYTSDGRYTSKIHEIDFRPALQAIMKH